MPYMDEFNSIVTTSKRNNIYYGPTESDKFRSAFTEIATDIKTVFNEINLIRTNINALASGYIMPSGYLNSLYDLKRELYVVENKFNSRIYTEGEQASVL